MSGTAIQPRQESLTALDRCDGCGAQAYVKVSLNAGGELLFCLHDANTHLAAVEERGVVVIDERWKLTDPPVVQPEPDVV